MGRVIGGDAEFYLRRLVRASYDLRALLLIFAFVGTADAKQSGKTFSDEKRDPNQLTMMVTDFDGTLAKNVGNYRLRRVSNVELVSAFFNGVSALPEEVQVPVYDFEGNLGLQIKKRIGHLNERGHFIASTSLEPLKLSNGQTIVPGYYYYDPHQSLREFRPPEGGGEGYLLSAVNAKLQKNERFLLDAFPLFSLALSDDYEDRVRGAVLTLRGHDEHEMRSVINTLQKKMKLGKRELPLEAFANLSNPSFYEFGFSKVNYLRRLYTELTERQMSSKAVPHFLVMFENDLEMIREIDALFQRLSNQGVFANPVVPVLVNLVEQEVLDNPDGHSWRWAPMRQVNKMSRVTVYWPNEIERTNDYARVLELSLGLSPEQAKTRLAKLSKNRFQCAVEVAGGGK